MTVTELLAQSRAAHMNYRGIVAQSPAPLVQQRAAITDALTFRLAAHGMDEQHADPAWATDRVPHADLVAFYQQLLAR